MEKELVFNQDGRTLTNSVLVAQKFGKKHKHVLEAIRKIIATAEKSAVLSMFVESSYLNEQNKQQPMYVMNRDGFTLLAMGFTGKEAISFKMDFIVAFNKMEQIIKEQNNIGQKPMTAVQMFALQAKINLENENRLAAIEKKLEDLEQEREENKRQLLALPVSASPVPEMTVRKNIIALVNSYCSSTNTAQQDAWHRIYQDLYYRYGKSINNYKRLQGDKSKLDIAERNGLLPYIMDIVSEMVSKTTQSA